jgi:hypothetical protein
MKMKHDTELIQAAVSRLQQICERLLSENPSDAARLEPDAVPLERGIYLWRWKENESAAYVGVALGKRGLRGRIIEQHLRPSYYKSVFRIKVAEYRTVDRREESVKYIKSHFTIAFVKCSGPEEDSATISAAEALVIAALRPQFNKIKETYDT